MNLNALNRGVTSAIKKLQAIPMPVDYVVPSHKGIATECSNEPMQTALPDSFSYVKII